MTSPITRILFPKTPGNSLSSQTLISLTSQVNSAPQGVIVLESEGNTFCAGASFDEIKEASSVESLVPLFLNFHHFLSAIKNSASIIICKVQGKAVGGGVGVIAACDYVIASEKAEIKLSEIAIGLAPFVIGKYVEEVLGKAFMTVALSNEFHDAKWCHIHNLFSEVVNETELDEKVAQVSRKFSEYSLLSFPTFKKLHTKTFSEDDALKRATLSAEGAFKVLKNQINKK